MGAIKKLDPSTILKLAAGEIIERPVSIVKELIENALDSSATTIRIDISKGGISEIQVSDNGKGIAHDDMLNTIESHATSKLTDFDDLQHVLTMGFRGEALASMSEVADMRIESFNGEDTIGTQLIKRPSAEPELIRIAREKGTTVCVSHLFKTIPVRFRFLKSATAEATAITRLVQTFGLHYPQVQFELVHNGNTVIKTQANAPLNEQFCNVLGIDNAILFEKTSHDICVHGALSPPNVTFKQRNKCWFSVNGRLVKSGLFFKAVDQALCDIIPKHHYPALVCNIDIDPNDVDINVHPQKVDVKFSRSDDVFLAIKRAIQWAAQTPTNIWDAANHQLAQPPEFMVLNDMPVDEMIPPSMPSVETGSMIEFSQQSVSPLPLADHVFSAPPRDASPPLPRHVPMGNANEQSSQWLSFKQKYIIVPLSSHVLIFDQHAVHERILYDTFTKQVANSATVSLPLLVPEYIQVPQEDMAQMDELIGPIRSLGIDFDRFDDDLFIVREVPQCFYGVDMQAWLLDWLTAETLAECVDAPRVKQLEMLQLKACKAAIKAGQRLNDASVQALIAECSKTTTPYTCPHGRPLFIKMSEQQLDGLFLRS
ncbi:MAG: DNA mismatch repair endonuclease MutL [Candidatus Margulisbacteria bacterium]|nr:DNA mismatch repair endonuclease MutL [Candidatus Margulisiibacteriota bacterium]